LYSLAVLAWKNTYFYGALDPADQKRIDDIRKQIDVVLTHPTTKAIKKAGV
jgi:hypothetical protein